jgi:ABC-2 type transport system permease protein
MDPYFSSTPGVAQRTRFNAWTNFSGISALFGHSVQRLCRPQRLVMLAILFLSPTLIALLARSKGATEPGVELEFALILSLVPTGIIPFAALINSAGVIQDEVEDQTLTYLLIRPIPRTTIYAVKLLGSIFVTLVVALACTAINEAVIFSGEPPPTGSVVFRIAKLAALYVPTTVAYCALFGLIGLLFRKSLPVGIVYIFVLEGFLSSIPFVFRKLTISYYFRSLAFYWFGDSSRLKQLMKQGWAIEPDSLPTAASCVLTLFLVAIALISVACWYFSTRELRVKTPEST